MHAANNEWKTLNMSNTSILYYTVNVQLVNSHLTLYTSEKREDNNRTHVKELEPISTFKNMYYFFLLNSIHVRNERLDATDRRFCGEVGGISTKKTVKLN